MLIGRKENYTYYEVLYINKASFDDIKQRLQERDVAWKYISKDKDGREIIVLGSTALKSIID